MTDLPSLALSVRQPWAWAIIYAGKDIENRTAIAISKGSMRRGVIAVHAARTMTREEYYDARDFMLSLGIYCPPPAMLERGGVIGSVEVVDIVKESASSWWFGPRGLMLAKPAHCDFVPARGALGYFSWRPADASTVPPPARWMLPRGADPPAPRAPDLFG